MKTPQLANLKRWWQQRPLREKLMLGACSLGVVLALGDGLVLAPAEKRLRLAQATEAKLQTSWDQKQSRKKHKPAPDLQLLAEEAALRSRLEQSQARLGALNTRLADSAQLPDVLRDLVATMGNTTLLELSLHDTQASARRDTAINAPTGPELAATAAALLAAQTTPGAASPPATAENSAANSAANPGANTAENPAENTAANPASKSALLSASASSRLQSQVPRVHQLPITLKVSGSWSELVDLLGKIETRAPALRWQQFSLDNSQWPAIELTLRAQVASLQPRWGAPS